VRKARLECVHSVDAVALPPTWREGDRRSDAKSEWLLASSSAYYISFDYPFGDAVLYWKHLSLASLLLMICSSLVGCGSGLDTVPVKGVLTYKGQPVPKIAVSFMPEGGKGQIAQGITDAEGNFELQTREPGDGAMIGNYLVAFRFVPDEVPEMPGFPGSKPVVSPLPPKYADSISSGVTATVVSDASKNVFNFDLK
jgi:hypothetical protein